MMLRMPSLLCMVFISLVAASGKTSVTGRITGSDEAPMMMANVILTQPPDFKMITSAPVDKDGKFDFTIDTTGIWMLQFTGVHYDDHVVALYVDTQKTIHLNVQLGTYDYLKDFNDVKVVGSFNNWYPPSAVRMQKQSDSIFFAEIESETDSVVYRLLGVRDGDAVEGTQADRYTYNGAGGYNSIVAAKNGKVRIVFDQRRLDRSGKPPKVAFIDTDSVTSKFASFYDEFQQCQGMYQAAFRDFLKSRSKSKQFKYDRSGAIASIELQLTNETHPVLQKELYLNYLTLAMLDQRSDTSIYRTCLERISPTSILWLLNPHSMYYALSHSKFTEAQRGEYVNQVISGNPVARIKAVLLYDEFHVAKYSGQTDKAAHYYDLLMSQFGDTPEGVQIKKSFPHEIDLMIGKPIPAFSVKSMEDPSKTFSNESLKGKYYLLNFWATTSKRCIDEMKTLNDAYKKFKGSNFQILSISVDSTMQEAAKFRKGKWKMPWLHAFLGADLDNKVVSDFQVIMVPKFLLVDPNGNLAAIGEDLNGNKLMETLKKNLGK